MNTCEKISAFKDDIFHLLHTKFNIAQNRLSVLEEKGYFGTGGLLAVRDLVYLVYFLEKKYDVTFMEEDYNNPDFYTVEGLSCILREKKDDLSTG